MSLNLAKAMITADIKKHHDDLDAKGKARVAASLHNTLRAVMSVSVDEEENVSSRDAPSDGTPPRLRKRDITRPVMFAMRNN